MRTHRLPAGRIGTGDRRWAAGGRLGCYAVDVDAFYLAFVGAWDDFDDFVPWETHERDLLP